MGEVDFEDTIWINGTEKHVHVFGSCFRGFDRSLICRVHKVMCDGQDILPALKSDDIRPLTQRLWHRAISARHPGGDCVEQEVGT